MRKFNSSWLFHSYLFLVVMQVMDALTTWVGLRLGAEEANRWMIPLYVSYGFWGMMVWKFVVVAAMGAVVYAFYRWVEKSHPERLRGCSKVLTVGFFFAALGTAFTVLNNLVQIGLAFQDLAVGGWA